jgi:thioredoxin 1/putative thioredoxin
LRALIEPHFARSQSALQIPEFLKLAKAGRVVAIDTRDRNSYTRAHIPGAIHLSLTDIEASIDRLAATGKVPVLYCRSGLETKVVAEKLGDQGYPIAFLEGGILAWEVAGQPIERGEN